VSAIVCEYPYIFGTSINTKGIANGQGSTGIAGSQTTAYGLDDVSQSVAYANGTGESNARTNGEAIFTTQLSGANTNADGVNTGNGNALADSVSKSFNPYESYYGANYAQYIDFLNSLFNKYPEKRAEILKIVLQYTQASDSLRVGRKLAALDTSSESKSTEVKATEYKNTEYKNYESKSTETKSATQANQGSQTSTNNQSNQSSNNQETETNQESENTQTNNQETNQSSNNNNQESESTQTMQGLPLTIANYDNAGFNAIGQTTFDYQRARGSGQQTAASTRSGNFRWNNATVHQGGASGNARQGWATSSSNNYGLGKVNYVNSEQNSGANGTNAQTNSESNYYLARDGVWNNGDAWGRAEGRDSLAFSNLNGNSYGYGAVNGDTNSYTDGNLSVSKSQIKGAPYFPSN